MDGGEGFTVIDVLNPNAWAETDTVLPEAIRVQLDKLEENLPRIPKDQTCSGILHMAKRGV
jgi:hypothetical protein